MYNIEEILDKCDFVGTVGEFIDLKPKGKDYEGVCPMCGKTLKVSSRQASKARRPGIIKCFKCDFGTTSLIELIEKVRGWSTGEAVKWLAQRTGSEPLRQEASPKLKPKAMSFKNRKLAESGLESRDIIALESCEDGTVRETPVFASGSINEYWNIIDGDDIIIRYLDIDGKQLKYDSNRGKVSKDYFRVRWQVPESHLLANGDICKYKSPYKSGVQIYIPETIRQIFKGNHTTETLYLTEGELKAEKMCKHGMPAFGLGGINSIAGKGCAFPDSIVRFIERCGVKNVILVADSDWDKLSPRLTSDKPADARPRSFAAAIRNFRLWFTSLQNRNIHLNLYFAGLSDIRHKGIDDLLVSLVGNENRFSDDVKKGMIDKHGKCQYSTVLKVSSITDTQINSLFSLESVKEFALLHRQALENLGTFKIGYNKWRFNDEGNLEPAQPILQNEQFWDVRVIGEGENRKYEYKFNHVKFYYFLLSRNIYKYKKPDGKRIFIRIENSVITEVDHIDIRDSIMELLKNICEPQCLNMLYGNASRYFGPDNLSSMQELKPDIVKTDKFSQNLYFGNNVWTINNDTIKETSYQTLSGNVWSSEVKKFEPKLNANRMISVERITNQTALQLPSLSPYIGNVLVELSPEAMECQFVRYLMLTSNMAWAKMYDADRRQTADLSILTTEERMETNLHLLSKITAIGYLLHNYRDKSHEKAVICMDAKITTVGDSNGRSGKSLFGMAIGEIVNQCVINGKRSNLEDDNFLFEEVDDRTRNIFIDDVRTNFDLEYFFPVITGILQVNGKGIRKYTLHHEQVPKLLITTNHAISGSSSSFKDRQFKIAFSDYFSDEYKPVMEFCNNFFSEWDHAEWNRFYNFIAECLRIYMYIGYQQWGQNGSGLIAAPAEAIEKRRLRQEIHEVFFQWANEYYGIDEDTMDVMTATSINLNCRISRQIIYSHFVDNVPKQTQKFIQTPNEWKKRLMKWCQYHGLRLNPVQMALNPDRPPIDKTNGTEYLTVANSKFEYTQ